MGGKRQILVALLAAALTAGLITSCGGGGSDSSTEVSSEFLNAGGENQIPKFGRIADDAEREAASRVLEENLDARAARDFARQCASLSTDRAEELEKFAKQGGGPGRSCADYLKYEVKSTEEIEGAPAASFLANTMAGPIDVLRVNNNNEAYALYHGTKGKDYSMAMLKEDGEWRVNSLTTQEP